MTNKCVGIMFQNEEHWLRLHLPFLVSEEWDLVMLDGGSRDSSNYEARKYTDLVFEHKFENHWGNQVNWLLERAEHYGYKYMIRLDPDELMFREEMRRVFGLLEYQKYQSIALPRFNFEYDRNHYCKGLWPDYQARAFEISEVSFSGKVHERINVPPISISDAAIYHYEGLNNMPYRILKGINYQRIKDGLLPLDELPRDIAEQPMSYRPHVPFVGLQPATFENARAPF